VLGADGERLAKRHGAVSLADLAADGVGADRLRAQLAVGLDLADPGEPVSMPDLLARFDPARVPLAPWTFARQ
jgi:glutamyl-tRNA synthetase